MRKMKLLLLFTSVLTMLAYTACGGSSEMINTAEAPAPAIAQDAAPAPAVADDGGAMDDAAPADIMGEAIYEFSADDVKSVAGDSVKPSFSPSSAGDSATPAFSPSGADVAYNAPAYAEDAPDDDIIIEPDPIDPDPEITPSVGMLTAGQWNDHDNWGFFSNLVNTGLIAFPSFGIDPTQRIAVTVTDASGTPLPNVTVSLEDDSQILWTSITDKAGKAYVFEMNGQGTKITASQGDLSQTTEITSAETDEQGNALASDRETVITLDAEQKLYHDTQIMFIVDTTGSMGDEMLFLQSDFSAITEEVGDENTLYAVNFYKDEGDIYVTNFSGFTADTQAIKNKLNEESASGGGDEPEAVYQALKESIFEGGWNEESVKIAFLIYDAPPHADTEFQEIMAEASAKGIHLIPVVSSNGSRETEIFGRALAICTNGSYVFLTDDSGIGGSHLEPIIGDYEVESLHDIIVRIINSYKQ